MLSSVAFSTLSKALHQIHPRGVNFRLLIVDQERDRYQVLNIAWQELTRVFGCIIYVEIKDGKIWIERDGTEIGVKNELVEAEVPKQDIVLAFQAPDGRKFTEFAVG